MEFGSLHFSFRPRKGAYPLRAIWLLCVVLMLIPRAGAAQGEPVGPEFQVNTYTTSYQRSPAIFGQRYNMMVPVELLHVRVE